MKGYAYYKGINGKSQMLFKPLIIFLSTLSKSELNKIVYLSNGNLKLKSNDLTKFLVFSLPAVKTCPNATEMCKANCYALKAEKQYKECKASRQRNLNVAIGHYFFMAAMIANIARNIENEKRLTWFRIHESGDFFSKEYLEAWLFIIKWFKKENIVFHAYSKSFDLFHDIKLSDYPKFRFIASVWADTKTSDLIEIASKGYKIYTAFEKNSFPSDHKKCVCADCAKCKMCINSNINKIACEIH